MKQVDALFGHVITMCWVLLCKLLDNGQCRTQTATVSLEITITDTKKTNDHAEPTKVER